MKTSPHISDMKTGALTNIQFADIFNLKEIQRLQDLFSDASGVASIITNPNGTPITNPSNFCRLCTDIIRKTEKGRVNCYHSDALIGRKNLLGPIVQPCLSGGLWDAGASINVSGKHIANWLIGQVRNEELDEQKMIQYADEIDANREDFRKALDEVPVMSVDQFNKVAKMLFAFASELSEKAYSNLKLKQQIAENEKAYEQIEKSEDLYKSILNASPDNIMITDMAGRALKASRSAFTMYGYQEDEVMGKIVTDFIAPDFRQQALSDISLMLQGTTTGTKEYQGERKDGSTFDIEVKGEYIRDVNGQPTKAIFITHDITERKRTEELLKASETKYRLITEKISDVVWLMDLNGKSLFVSQSIEKFTGYTVDEYLAQSIFDRFTPDSATFAYETLKKEVRLYSSPEGPPKDYQKTLIFEYRCKDGNTKTGEVIITPYFDEKNTLIGLHGVTRDITERKQAEDVLKNSEKEYRLLFMNNPTPMWVYDTNSLAFLAVNDFAVDHYGYSRQQFLNMTIKDIRIQDDIPCLNEVLQRDSGSLRKVKGVRHRRKDGSLIDVEITAHEIAFDGHASMFVNAMDVTERKLAEENLHHSEAKYRELVENLNDVVYSIGLDSIIHYVTPSVKMLGGYEPSELIGTSLFKLVHPDDLNFIRSAFAEVISGQTSPREYRILTKNGSVKWVRSSSRPITKESQIIGIQGVISDITERKQAEKALLENQRRLSSIYDTVGDVIFHLAVEDDGCYRFISVNKAFCNVTGISEEMIVGKLVNEVIPESSLSMVLEKYSQAIRENSVLRWEETSDYPTGRLIGDVSIAPVIDDKGHCTNLVGSVHDITERKQDELLIKEKTKEIEAQNEEYQQLNEELNQTNQKLIKAKAKAEESDHLKSAFLANMSHEIRTPMNGILGFAELLKEPELTGEQQHEYLGIIEKSGNRMLNIINDIIDISKIESGQMNVTVSKTNVNEQVEFIYNFFRSEIEKKGLQFFYKNALSTKEAIIFTDREKLWAILTNLVKNAIKYTKVGSIEIGYHVVETHDRASLRFYVKDTGIGIPNDRQEAIFERFIQADITDTMARQGAGLGLAISKAYVEMLGGKIWVESDPDNNREGQGSVFYFNIPYTIKMEEKIVNKNVVSSENIENQLNSLKILIAEDDEGSERLLSMIAKTFSKEVLKVKTGIEAVEVCRKNPDIDLVLMDIKMPEMDGYEATKQIRLFNKKVVIIAQTAYALIGDREMAIEAGCTDYISKPIHKDQLMILLQKYLKKYENEN